jgi:hypothetical protein
MENPKGSNSTKTQLSRVRNHVFDEAGEIKTLQRDKGLMWQGMELKPICRTGKGAPLPTII